jgi:hypothetical protein
VLANPRIDADRRRELSVAYVQTAVIAVILSVLVVSVSANLATWAFLEAGALFCACYRTWALDRFSPHDYDIYGRIAVARHLPALLAALQAGDELAKWPDRADVIHKIHAAGAQRQATAARILRSAGYPHRVPIPMAALAGTIVSFSGGIVLGAWLQGQAALQRPFRPLCGIPVSYSLERAVLALGMWQVWFCVLLLAAFKVWAWRWNRRKAGLIDAAFETTQSAAAQLADISKNGYRCRRMAIARDLDRIASLIGTSVTGAATVLEISNAGDTATGRVPPWLSRLSLSTPNELSKNQLLFVLGLWWGLAIPYLLHFACSGL